MTPEMHEISDDSEDFLQAELDETQFEMDLHTNDPEQLNIIGLSLIARGDFEDAKEIFQRLAELTPKDHEVWNNLGLVHRNLRNMKEAIKCLGPAGEENE